MVKKKKKVTEEVPRVLRNKFHDYERRIRRLKQLKKELKILNPRQFPDDVKVINSMLKNPAEVSEIERLIENLKKKMLKQTELEKLNAQIRRLEKTKKSFHRKFVRQCKKNFANKLKLKEHEVEMEYEKEIRQAKHNHLQREERIRKHLSFRHDKLLGKEKSRLRSIFHTEKRKLEKGIMRQRREIDEEKNAFLSKKEKVFRKKLKMLNKDKHDFKLEEQRVIHELEKKEKLILRAEKRLKKKKEKLAREAKRLKKLKRKK